jgi:hypothetical protein
MLGSYYRSAGEERARRASAMKLPTTTAAFMGALADAISQPVSLMTFY